VEKSGGDLVACVVAFLIFAGWGSAQAASGDGTLLYYRPQPQTLQYNLSITTRSQAVALFGPGPQEEHEDRIRLSQKVEKMGEGFLDIALTVDGINVEEPGPQARQLHLNPRGGSTYRRQEIIGNTGHTLINLLGAVKEVKGIPHFGSVDFHPQNLAGPLLGIYPVLTLVYPQFPMRLLKKGDSWKIKDEITIQSAEALPIRGLGTLKHELSMTVKRDLDYTLIDYVQRGKYQTVHIEFNGTFSVDGEMVTEAGGDYLDGTGRSSGELYFAAAEGLLVEVLIKSKLNEQKAKDGNAAHWFNSEVSMAVFWGQPTAAVTWLTDQDVHLVLADREDE